MHTAAHLEIRLMRLTSRSRSCGSHRDPVPAKVTASLGPGGKVEGGTLPGLPDPEVSDFNLPRQEKFKSKF